MIEQKKLPLTVTSITFFSGLGVINLIEILATHNSFFFFGGGCKPIYTLPSSEDEALLIVHKTKLCPSARQTAKVYVKYTQFRKV